jgi:hypothetical protein
VGNLVCTGATISCSFGTTPASFSASSTDVSATTAAGTISDVSPENVPAFGMCTTVSNPEVASATTAALGVLTPQACQPVLTPWSPGSAEVTVDGQPALDDASTCSCSWGGVISVSDAGQVDVTVQ